MDNKSYVLLKILVQHGGKYDFESNRDINTEMLSSFKGLELDKTIVDLCNSNLIKPVWTKHVSIYHEITKLGELEFQKEELKRKSTEFKDEQERELTTKQISNLDKKDSMSSKIPAFILSILRLFRLK